MSVDDIVGRCSRLLADVRAGITANPSPRAERVLRQWQEELEELVVAACEINIGMSPGDSILVAGQEVVLDAVVTSDKCRVELKDVRVSPAPGWGTTGEQEGDSKPSGSSRRIRLTPGPSAARSLPRITQQYRPIEDDDKNILELTLSVDGRSVSVSQPITLDLAPALEFTVSPRTAWLPVSRLSSGVEFEYTLVNRFPHKTAGTIDIKTPPEWRGGSESFLLEKEDGVARGMISVLPASTSASEGTVSFVTEHASTTGEIRLLDVNIASGINLGIVKSYDTTIETVARKLDIPFTMLNEKEIAAGDLSRFSSIVVDIRAYGVREDLKANNTRLLEYVRNGGNLVVFYQKTQDWKKEYAPYPFELTRDRITDEEAPVRVLQPEHPLLTQPNVIGSEDWLGWVQERGVYFPDHVPGEYSRILSSHDPDEPPLDTGLIVADFGRGSYIFTSYVWYRQMKEAHAGSIRFFANMISYPRRQQ